jgi:hypothetical protein
MRDSRSGIALSKSSVIAALKVKSPTLSHKSRQGWGTLKK